MGKKKVQSGGFPHFRVGHFRLTKTKLSSQLVPVKMSVVGGTSAEKQKILDDIRKRAIDDVGNYG